MKYIAGNPYLKNINGRLLFDNVKLDEILTNYETPLMVLFENRIRDNIRIFNGIFKDIFDSFECYYSFKANYLPKICEVIREEGIGAEIIGMPELKIALKVGFLPEHIIIGGPYLPQKLMEKAVELDVHKIIIYNLNDIPKLNTIAKKAHKVVHISIRVNSYKYNSKLGIYLNGDNLEVLSRYLKSCNHIILDSILSHYSTQMNSISQFRKNINSLSINLQKLSEYNISIKEINLGGGFPEAVIMNEKQLRKNALEIKKILDQHHLSHKKIIFEPGRYFVGDAGAYIGRVIKVDKDRWIFVNLGNHICPKFARCSLRFYNASRIEKAHKYKASIAGIIPTDQDVLAKDYFFTRKVEVGDYILIPNVGAYALTFSNRFPYALPQIFLIKDDQLSEIFNPEQDHDFSLV